MKYPIITVTALNLLLAAAMPVMADDTDDHSGVDRGEEINARLDNVVKIYGNVGKHIAYNVADFYRNNVCIFYYGYKKRVV